MLAEAVVGFTSQVLLELVVLAVGVMVEQTGQQVLLEALILAAAEVAAELRPQEARMLVVLEAPALSS